MIFVTLSLIVWFYAIIEAFMKKRLAGANPWGVGATTLEWTLSSPPPFHQFEVLPRITGASIGNQTKRRREVNSRRRCSRRRRA